MCLAKESYRNYMVAEENLRRTGMSKLMPGFEYLRIAAVISKERNISDEKMLIEEVKRQAPVVVAKREVIKERGDIEQAMIEAIRSVSATNVKMTIMDFIDQIVSNM